MNFIIPWVSLHFEQPMAKVRSLTPGTGLHIYKQAGLLFSLRALVSTLLYLVVLPAITTLISRTSKLTSASRDLALSRWSVFLICTGSFIVAFAPSLWILVVGFAITVLGSGASVTLRSFLASSVDPAFSGRLYTAISTVGTLGGLVGMPIMGAVYSWGLGHRSWNVAPPFMVAGVCLSPCRTKAHMLISNTDFQSHSHRRFGISLKLIFLIMKC
jgi:MFS family permease